MLDRIATHVRNGKIVSGGVNTSRLVKHKDKTVEYYLDQHSDEIEEQGTTLGGLVTTVQNLILDKLYPIGSIYLETTNTNPSSKLGGTWEAYGTSDSYLRLGGDGNGGSNSYSLTSDNIPSHTHTFTPSGSISGGAYTFSGSEVSTGNQSAGHTHTVNSHDHTISHTHGTNGSGNHTHPVYYDGTYGILNGVAASGSYWAGIGLNTAGISAGLKAWYGGDHTHSTNSISTTKSGSSSPGTGGISANHTHKVTASGSVSVKTNPTFTGSAGTTGSYGASSVTSIDITPKYVQVYAWKRVA